MTELTKDDLEVIGDILQYVVTLRPDLAKVVSEKWNENKNNILENQKIAQKLRAYWKGLDSNLQADYETDGSVDSTVDAICGTLQTILGIPPRVKQ